MSSCSAPCATCSSVADGRGTVDGCSLRVTAEAGRRAGGSGYRRRRGAATGPGGSPAVPTPSLEVMLHNNTGGADTVNNLYIAARRPTVDRRRWESGPLAPARALPAHMHPCPPVPGQGIVLQNWALCASAVSSALRQPGVARAMRQLLSCRGAATRGRDRCASADVAVGGVPVFHPRARLGSAGSCPAGPASGSGRLGGGVVVDSADECLGCGGDRLGAAGGAAEDQRALERRDGQVGEGRGAAGGEAQRFEAGNQRRSPPREHAVEGGAEFLVAGGQLQHHRGDRAAALVAR